MNTDFIILAQRLRETIGELHQVVTRIERASHAVRPGDANADLYIDAVALNLHDFYTGLERIFRLTGSTVDRSTPTSAGWHRDLLDQMCLDLPGVRPRVLSEATCEALGEFLRFRHVVRNLYTFQLDEERVLQLGQRARVLLEQVSTELLAFADYLERVGRG